MAFTLKRNRLACLTLLILHFLIILGCAEPTDISNEKDKVNRISNLSLLRSISRRPPSLNVSIRDKNDPLQMYNLGDAGVVDLKKDGEVYTFDYTGLGIDDSLANTQTNLHVLYFDNNTNYKEHNDNFIYPDNNNNGFIWSIANIATKEVSYSPSLTKDIFKYSTTLNNFNNHIERVVVKLTYMPLDSIYNFIYIYKGLSDGSSELEIVGYQVIIREDNYLLEDVGDTRLRTPYVPSGYN